MSKIHGIRLLLISTALALVPMISLAQDTSTSFTRFIPGNQTISKAQVFLGVKSVNIPTITCPSVEDPNEQFPFHACLVDVPLGAAITGIIAYRRHDLDKFYGDEPRNLFSDLELLEVKGNSEGKILDQFTLSGPDASQKDGAFGSRSYVKDASNAFVVIITDHYISGATPAAVPGEPELPPKPPVKPYAYGRSGVQMISVTYK